MKTDSRNTRIILDTTQGGANTDAVDYVELDAFDRQSGFLLRAIEFTINPTDIADIAADASVWLQVFCSTSAVPTGEYALGSKNIIANMALAIPLTTSGVGVVDCSKVWVVPDGSELILGGEYVGLIIASAGATSAINAEAILYGDSVTLTADEIATSRLRFV